MRGCCRRWHRASRNLKAKTRINAIAAVRKAFSAAVMRKHAQLLSASASRNLKLKEETGIARIRPESLLELRCRPRRRRHANRKLEGETGIDAAAVQKALPAAVMQNMRSYFRRRHRHRHRHRHRASHKSKDIQSRSLADTSSSGSTSDCFLLMLGMQKQCKRGNSSINSLLDRSFDRT